MVATFALVGAPATEMFLLMSGSVGVYCDKRDPLHEELAWIGPPSLTKMQHQYDADEGKQNNFENICNTVQEEKPKEPFVKEGKADGAAIGKAAGGAGGAGRVCE